MDDEQELEQNQASDAAQAESQSDHGLAGVEAQEMNVKQFRQAALSIQDELQKVIVGQTNLVHDLLVTLLSGGNALLEGVPGLGKTMLISTLANVANCTFRRIQFTPDLMPADIVGTMIISENVDGRRGFRFEPGPVFANIILADEINRASPRTQSALLEAMQERCVTIAGETRPLPQPFFVLATQNPIEMEGTYPLPEAQLDRFLYKIDVPYPSEDDLVEIARRTTGKSLPTVDRIIDGAGLIAMQELAKGVPVADQVFRYAARLVSATHPDDPLAPKEVERHLRVGASPRGVQAMIWAAKVEALLDDRKAVAIDDIKKVAYPALRHRLILKFEALADGVPPDALIEAIEGSLPVPK